MHRTQIAFLLLPSVHLQDLAGPAQVFFEATELGAGHFQLHYISPFPTLMSTQGLSFGPLRAPESLVLGRGDMVCVPGFDFASFQSGRLDTALESVREWVWQQRRRGVYIASICSGALALGRLGLLDHTACTSHWKCLAYMRAAFPRARLIDNQLYIFDRGICTSAGMTAGIDMSLALVEQWRNPLLAAKVAREMVIESRRAGSRGQQNVFLDFKNQFSEEVYQAREILANHLESAYTIDDLARDMNRSSRHLSRLFRQHTGQTVQQYRDQLRLEKGEQLLRHTQLSIKEIALACGFADVRQFSRLWKARRGSTPAGWRKANAKTVTDRRS